MLQSTKCYNVLNVIKSVTFVLQKHKLKFHPFKYATHELKQTLNHGRRTVQTASWGALKRSCPAELKTPFD